MRINRGEAVLLFLAAAWSATAADLSVTSAKWNGIELQFAAKLEPPGPASMNELRGAVLTGPDRPHRLIFDAGSKRYFVYDLVVKPIGDQKVLQIRLEPPSLTAQQLGVDPTWTKMLLPKYPVAPAVRVGETLAVDLLVNPSTGQKIVEYITLL